VPIHAVHLIALGQREVPIPAVRVRSSENGTEGGRDVEKGRVEREVAQRRRLIVEAVRAGTSQRAVAARCGVGQATVRRALVRAGDRPLDEVDWADHSSAPHRTRRTSLDVERRVAELRASLTESILGDHGPAAIHAAMVATGEPVPSIRTIARIIERTGLLERRRRVRRPAPPRGWYLPAVAARETELDEFDAIVDLKVFGRGSIDVLTGVSLHGGDPDAWLAASITANRTCIALTERWTRIGYPGFAQFDNDSRFLGGHGYPDILGPVPLFALERGVTPVFAPLREMGFQAGIEGFNAYWQRRVYRRAFGLDPVDVTAMSDRFLAALRTRRAVRIEAAPVRRPMAPVPPPGARARTIIFLRRTTLAGSVEILGRLYPVDRAWAHRLVRAELDLDELRIRCFALRRRDPTFQPLLNELPYRLPANRTWVSRMY
jgi:hypothetical protein